jgi:hypothetical protein
MRTLYLAIFELIRDLLSGRTLWGVLALATILWTFTVLGVTGRLVLWLETIQSRDRA